MRRAEGWLRPAALLWIFLVVAFYYVAHKPFTAANLLALAQGLAGLVGGGLVVALGAGVGLWLLRSPDLGPGERLVWAAAVGLGALSLVGLGLGAVGLLKPWLLWLLTVAGLATTGRRLLRSLRTAWASPSWRPQSRFEGLLLAYCGLTLGGALLWAMTPPTAWDGLVYHLTGPRLYLEAGRVVHPLDLPYLGFPEMVETLFTWGMGLAGERAAAVIHWFYGLLVVLGLVAAGRRWLGTPAGWLAAAVLLSAPTVILLVGWPYVDLTLMLYSTLAFLALVRGLGSSLPPGHPTLKRRDEALKPAQAGSPQDDGRNPVSGKNGVSQDASDKRWLILSGVFTGLALSTKYTALALLPALALALLATRSWRPGARIQDLQSALCNLLLLGTIALLIWSPWLLKNLLLTGNPTYPFFFDGLYWDEWRAWWYDRPGTGLAYTAPWKLLTAPWDATVWGIEGAEGYSATIGPLFLALLPLLPLVWRRLPARRRRWLRGGLVFCGVLYLFWLWGVARTALLIQTRLLFPAFGILALMAGATLDGLQALPRRPVDLGWLARAVVAGVLLLTLIGTLLTTVQGRPLGVLLGFESREEFLTRRLGWYSVAIQYINRELPPDGVVLFLWEPRSYHCRADCRPDALLDRWLHTTYLYGHDADRIAALWRSEGVTHVLLHRAGLDFILEDRFDPVTPADVQTLEELLTHHLTPMENFGSAYELYRLEGVP